jgi:zinc D-Ala-D-Ala carboxypeptidase
MKKLILLNTLSILLFASACARTESYLEKVPFLKKIVHDNEIGQAIEEPTIDSGQTNENNEKSNSSSTSTSDKNEDQNDELILEEVFFNEIKEMNGKSIIQNPTNTMALVNKQFELPASFLPEDLTRPKVNFSFGNLKIEKSLLRIEAALALEKMFTQAEQSGIELFAVSGYRSYEYQATLFEAEVNRIGREKAVEAVAYPGKSEHQTGLAIDISSRGEGMMLTESFGSSKEGEWLTDNAHRYGFILRYPRGKELITGYQYEAWHFRYIGVEAATIIYKNNWTLEEYFNIVKKI